jgi:hypothetical protein
MPYLTKGDMRPTPSLADFDDAIRRLGAAFYVLARARTGEAAWDHAVLEVRYAADGSYWNDKMRLFVPRQPPMSLDTNNDIKHLLITFSELRCVLGWYSLRLQVSSDGEVKAEYGYDPTSVEDSAFFAD